MTVVTERAEIEARAIVTARMRPVVIDGREVHQVALPFHWGYAGATPGDIANDLIALSGDPNVTIEEAKAFTCDVRAGRRTREPTEPLRGAHADIHVNPNEDHPAEEPKLRSQS
jgi:formate dehydrogenase major subunit